MNQNPRASEMELGYTHIRGIDSQTMSVIAIHPDMSSTLDNTNIKQEPTCHTDRDSSELSENMKPVDDITRTVDVNTEVIDNCHYQDMDIRYNHDMYSNSNYIDTAMIRKTHVAPVKSEPPDEPLETTDRTEFIIEIDTCKDEYYETHGYPNSEVNVNVEECGVERESGEDCVTTEDMYMEDSDPQLGQEILHTSVDTMSHTAALSDMQYTSPNVVSQSSVQVHVRERKLQMHIQPTAYVHALQQANDKPYKCSVCGVGFVHKWYIATHMRIHTGEKPYKCSVCGVEFNQKGDLKKHILIHTGEKPHTCSVCEVSFTRKGHLTAHTRTHTGEKPHKCTVCGDGFGLKHSLKRHTRIHTGEKPHKCSICEVSFTQKGNLTYHMRTHTGEKPYTCAECGACFRRIQHMHVHQRTHTGDKSHKCSICGVGFSRKGDLTVHTRIHTGEKPHTCSVRGVAYAQAKSFKKHAMTHT